jgi:hypothetical protein
MPATTTFPELTEVQLQAGRDMWPVVLYNDGVYVLWVAYVHDTSREVARGKAAGRVLALDAAKTALRDYRKNKVSCKICDDSGCYTCDG